MMDSSEFDFIGESNLKLHISVTRGPSAPPEVNIYATQKVGGDLCFSLRLDLPHAQELIDKLISSCELIEEDMIIAGNSQIQ